MDEDLVISASRTKDLVRVSPARLVEILRGEAPARFGLGRELHTISLDRVGALAVWTKDPSNLITHASLRKTLQRFVHRHGGVILLNLTVTGLGGTVLEPGIPPADAVLDATKALLDGGIVRPAGIILRYDPLIEVSLPGGTSLGNVSMDVFETVLEAFRPTGFERMKTSLADMRYAHVPRRMGSLGLRINLPDDNTVAAFYRDMQRRCRPHGIRLDACCHPPLLVGEETRGCIDGLLINRLLEETGSTRRVTTDYHNDIGRQRSLCRCTYSRDIGYSAGFQTCFKDHGACLYCFSQRNTKGRAVDEAKKRINNGGKNPIATESTCCSD